MLLPCPLTRTEGFSIELFGRVNGDIHSPKRKGTCESLSLSELRQRKRKERQKQETETEAREDSKENETGRRANE